MDKELHNQYEIRAKQVDMLSVTYMAREACVKNFYEQRSSPIVRLVKEVVHNLKPNRLLDLGCGEGWYIKQFPDKKNVIGLDFCRRYLLKAKHFCGKNCFVNADAQILPFQDGSFDLILCTEVIEHVSNPKKLLGGMRRILSKRGIAIITSPMRKSPIEIIRRIFSEEHDLHINVFKYEEFLATISAYFKILRVEATMFVPLTRITYPLYAKLSLIRTINSTLSRISVLRNLSGCIVTLVAK